MINAVFELGCSQQYPLGRSQLHDGPLVIPDVLATSKYSHGVYPRFRIYPVSYVHVPVEAILGLTIVMAVLSISACLYSLLRSVTLALIPLRYSHLTAFTSKSVGKRKGHTLSRFLAD
ncbi:hypothetical protein BDN72DRAFT_80235 [Pluteus cervinus]|uniref:Uncharacterized protein n=1 Tax=Pluteus cervinus TaxID=181527 RepID=A0ACD3BBB8_9AGAR|nr:hypothetical protein BDN72DRAFT_80235 [Pluteus cervinus]